MGESIAFSVEIVNYGNTTAWIINQFCKVDILNDPGDLSLTDTNGNPSRCRVAQLSREAVRHTECS